MKLVKMFIKYFRPKVKNCGESGEVLLRRLKNF